MKYSKSLIRTLRECPSDCDSESYALMYRTGMIKKESSGLFTYLPYFNMIIRKVEDVIREELSLLDAQECKFPILVSRELLEKSERWTSFGEEMFAVKDRHQNDYALSPTNEEAAAMIAKQYVNSFRDLPLTVYQINTKHRDEIRPRGIGRTRAFTMKDAYSFHSTEESLDQTYQDMVKAYVKIFKRLGLEGFPVNADNGTMGGTGSQEIMVPSKEGDAEVLRCPVCGYAANSEVVPCIDNYPDIPDVKGIYKKVETPHVGTIEELVSFFNTDSTKFAKSLVYETELGEKVVAIVRGDREVNEIKLRNILKAKEIVLASERSVNDIGSYIGFVGPIGLKEGVKILVDNEVKGMRDFIVGANELNQHYVDVNCLDFDECSFVDIRTAVDGDLHECGGAMELMRATELGHCFKLGKRYTEKLDVTYTDSDNLLKTMTMGCYGIGIERTVTAIIEKYHDDKGIMWPMHIAPLKIDIIPSVRESKEPRIWEEAKRIYAAFDHRTTLFDDRDNVSVGVKFKDADLLGIPLKVIVGKSYLESGLIEIEHRASGIKETVEPERVIERLREIIATESIE